MGESIQGELLEVREAPAGTPPAGTQANVSPSAAPQPKVLAGAGGAGIGGALALILPWLIKTTTGAEMPVEVALGFGSLFSIIGSFVAGYFTPPRSM
jgi:hypothetical protein